MSPCALKNADDPTMSVKSTAIFLMDSLGYPAVVFVETNGVLFLGNVTEEGIGLIHPCKPGFYPPKIKEFQVDRSDDSVQCAA